MDFLQRVGKKLVSAVNRAVSGISQMIPESAKKKTVSVSKRTLESILGRLKVVEKYIPYYGKPKKLSQKQQEDNLVNFVRQNPVYTSESRTDLSNDGKPAVFSVEYKFDTSDKANIIFPLADKETTKMFLELKNQSLFLVPTEILNNEGDYTLHSTMTFESEKSGALFTIPFGRKKLTAVDVDREQAMKDIEYGGVLSSVRFLYSALGRKVGGCSERERFLRMELGREKVRLCSPKGKDNNCAFMCYIKFLGLNGREEKPNDLRKKLGFEPKTKISVEDLKKISNHFNIGHIVFFNDTIVDEYRLDREKRITLCLEHEHFSFVVDKVKPKKKCEDCGAVWVKTHNCNINMEVYFQSKIHPDGKIWEVPPHNRTKETDQDMNSLVFWDAETFPDAKGKHIPYAIGWKTEGQYYYSKGENCLNEFLDFVLNSKNKIFISFNGAKYDHYFLYQRLLCRGISFGTKDIILNNGRILKIRIPKIKVEFKDLYQFMPTFSLSKACESFGCKVAKGDFNHSLIKKWADVETHFDGWSPYLKLDVECLEDLYTVFSKTVYDITKFHTSDFITLSSMAFDFWKTTIPKKAIEKITDREKRDFINNSVYGGRCYPLRKEWRSPYFQDILDGKMSYKELKKTLDGFIFNADATSLYPASMNKHKYPIGLCRWSHSPKEDFENGVFGIFKVKWECKNRKLRVPVLPVRGCNGLDQTLIGREGYYNNIDIENAISVGYEFEFLDKALVWDETCDDLFDAYIQTWFQIKKENSSDDGNKALRQISKLLMNSLYGKMLQGEVSDNMAVCGTIHDFWLFTKMNDITDWISSQKDDGTRSLTLFGLSKKEDISGKPRHLGSFIVAYSKRIMLDYMKAIDPTLESCVFSYHDTDSLHILADAYHKLKSKGCIQESGDSDLGMLCNDTKKDGLIIYEKNLGAKNYHYIYLGNDGVIYQEYKCKGLMKTDKLDGNKPILTPELWDNEEVKPLEYKSFQRIMKPTKAQRQLGLDSGDIRTIVNTRTFYKNGYDRMILHDNHYYPMGYDFS